MSNYRRLLASAFIAAAALLASPAAHADIITALNGNATVAVPGGFAYTYNVELTGQQQLDPYSNGLQREFGTLYDFGPIVGTITATGILARQFVFTTQLTNTAANQTAPTDSPTLTNIRFSYTGETAYYVNSTTNPAGSTQLTDTTNNLGTFTVVSLFDVNTSDATLQYDGQARKGTNDTITGNVGYTAGPQIPPAFAEVEVPEPASLVLLTVGLLGAGILRRRQI